MNCVNTKCTQETMGALLTSHQEVAINGRSLQCVPGRGKLPSIPPLSFPTCHDLRGDEAVAFTTDVSPTATRHNEDSLAIVDVVSTGMVHPLLAKVGQFQSGGLGAIEVVLLHCAKSKIILL